MINEQQSKQYIEKTFKPEEHIRVDKPFYKEFKDGNFIFEISYRIINSKNPNQSIPKTNNYLIYKPNNDSSNLNLEIGTYNNKMHNFFTPNNDEICKVVLEIIQNDENWIQDIKHELEKYIEVNKNNF